MGKVEIYGALDALVLDTGNSLVRWEDNSGIRLRGESSRVVQCSVKRLRKLRNIEGVKSFVVSLFPPTEAPYPHRQYVGRPGNIAGGVWLTEKLLGKLLVSIFPYDHFEHNKVVPNSGIRNRPDYRCAERKLIVEFDGYGHFTKAKNVATDKVKDSVYTAMGYKVVRIPYWVQLDVATVEYYFGVVWEPKDGEVVDYSHGFNSDTCVMPADFCTAGYSRYRDIMQEIQDNERYFGEFCYERIMYVGQMRMPTYDLFDPNPIDLSPPGEAPSYPT